MVQAASVAVLSTNPLDSHVDIWHNQRMAQHTFNLALTDELTAFIDRQTGPGTTYSTRSEYLRALIREQMERAEAAALRAGVIEGFADAAAGRVNEYDGDLKSLMNAARDGRDA